MATMLNIKLTIFCLFCWLLSSIHTQAQDSTAIENFSLDQCIQYALDNNQNIGKASLQIKIAQAEVGEFLAQGLPQVSGIVDLNYNPVLRRVFLEGGNDGGTVASFGLTFGGDASVAIQQLIVDGSYFVGLKAARTFKDVSKKEFILTKIDVIEAVTKAYLSILINKEALRLANDSYERLDTLLKETRVLYENGFVEEIDVDRVELNFNNVLIERDRLQRLLYINYDLLKFQMGMPLHEQIKLSTTLDEINFTYNDSYEQEFEYSQRIEYSILETNQTLAELDLKRNYSTFGPTLSAYGNVGALFGSSKFSDFTNFNERWFGYTSVGLKLQVPVLLGLKRFKTIQKNKLTIQQIEYDFSKLKNGIDLEIKQAKAAMENNIQKLEIQQKNMKLAEKVFQVARIKYNQGAGSNIEIINADNSYKEARNNYYLALYNAINAHIDLDKALGRLGTNY